MSSELSKTAKASMKAGMSKKQQEEQIAPKEAINQIRMNLSSSPISFTPSHLIKILLEEYDKLNTLPTLLVYDLPKEINAVPAEIGGEG